jgi:thioester reductase-like protein
VVGDLARPLLGLAPAAFARLAEEADVVHHCGAVVRWAQPYASLRSANVGGTHEVLRLAAATRTKPVHFISTVGVFSSPEQAREVVLEGDALEESGPLHVGYAQSKWVAEKLVRLAGARGLPVSVYRPNTIGDSRTGVFNLNDHVFLMLRGCLRLGLAPELSWEVCGAPVDFVARAIVGLSTSAPAGGTFHLVSPNGARWGEVCDWLRALGYPLRQVPYAEWSERLVQEARATPDGALLPLVPFVSEGLLRSARLPRFDTRDTDAALARLGLACPALGPELLATTLEFLVRNGHLPASH